MRYLEHSEEFQADAVSFRFLISSAPHFEQAQDDGTLKCLINLCLSSQTSCTLISDVPLTEQQSQLLS